MFRTELTILPQERQLSRSARILTLGSCFADSLGERLRQNKVAVLTNPFGTVFQPLALAQLLRAAAGEGQDWQQHVVEARGRWQSYDLHGSVGADSPVELLQDIERRARQTGDFLRSADAVVLTLGTAWAYRLHETGELVSNLHKMPADLFVKELLTADEIVNALAEVHALLRRIKPDIHIVLTVSPVRHIKDTLPLNAVSKSVLRVACHYLSTLLPGVSYFPAYELLTDDLRDYRFYGADMLHPSEMAEDYVWDKFARAYFNADFGHFRKEWAAVRQSLGHRPLHEGAPEHRFFLDQTRERLERLAGQGVDVRQELRDVQRQLVALPPPRPVHAPEAEVEDDGEERIDIGQDGIADAAPAAQPQHEREGRGRNRRGRGRGRGRERDQERPAAEAPATQELLPVEEPLAEIVAEAVPLEAAPAVEDTEEAAVAAAQPAAELEAPSAYPAKKKKRRSRGGAKRTARKHAARLAAGQDPAATDTAETVTAVAEPETADFAAAELTTEPEAAAAPTATPQPEPLAEAADSELDLFPITDELAALEPTADAAPELAAPRRRGTGPTPRKSKVIAKSMPVKRVKAKPLFNAAAPAAPAPADEPVPAEAPIVSPPIVPAALLTRPATLELTGGEDIAAAPTAATLPTEPARPRRGRPKAAPATAASAEPTVPAEVVTAKPTPAKRVAAPKAAAKPKAASKAKPAAKAPKSAAATEPTTPRRGRPPGKKAAPADGTAS